MTHLETYCDLNRILLLSIGLWPYQQSKFSRFQYIFLYIILSTGIIFQLTPLITFKYTTERYFVTKVLSSVSISTMFMIQYHSFCLNIEVVKNLLMQLEHIHNNLKDKNEIAIVYKYSCIAKRYTVALTVFGVCGMLMVIIAQIWSNVTVDISMNVSQLHHLFFMTEYFVDQEKHFYLILLHMYIALFAGTTIMLGIGTMMITYIKHTCGMFKIASYRIKHAVNTDTLQNITVKNKYFMIKGIICAVDIHCQAMRLSKHFVSTFEIMMVCFTGCVVICFSLNLFQFFQIASSKNNFKEVILPVIYMFISISYMFISNYIGQNIADHNNHVFLTAYNVQWYRTPLHIQRMILFLLQRESKKFTLKVGGIIEASVEHFATVLKASISYFTVIYSTQ